MLTRCEILIVFVVLPLFLNAVGTQGDHNDTSEVNRQYFFFDNLEVKYNVARDTCVNKSLTIIEMHDELEIKHFTTEYKTRNNSFEYWTGLVRTGDGEFRWGSNNEEITISSAWKLGEPKFGSNCVVVGGEGKFKVTSCDLLHKVVCYREPERSTTEGVLTSQNLERTTNENESTSEQFDETTTDSISTTEKINYRTETGILLGNDSLTFTQQPPEQSTKATPSGVPTPIPYLIMFLVFMIVVLLTITIVSIYRARDQ